MTAKIQNLIEGLQIKMEISESRRKSQRDRKYYLQIKLAV